MSGRLIILNGTSSAGKSVLAQALREALDEPFCHYASDQLADAGFRPLDGDLRAAGRDRFFDGFHRSIAAFGEAGNDIIVEHIVETPQWAAQLDVLLRPFDAFWVGVHAPLEELERREAARGDRRIGEARYHFATHGFCRYDIEVDTTRPIAAIAGDIVAAWRGRRHGARH